MEFEEFIIRLIFAFKSAQKSIEEKNATKNIPKIFIYLPYSKSYLNLKKNFFNKKQKSDIEAQKNSQRKFRCEFLLIIKKRGSGGT